MTCISLGWFPTPGMWARHRSAKELHVTQNWTNAKTDLNEAQFQTCQYAHVDGWAVRNPGWMYRLIKQEQSQATIR